MSDNTQGASPTADTTTDLDAFSSELFGQSKDTPVTTKTEKETQDDVKAGGATPDAHSEPDDTGSEPEDNDDGSEPSEKPPVKAKTRFQERIDELTAKAREAERKYDELREQLNKGQDKTPAQAPQIEKAELTEPTAVDLNEDGTEKYPLGEFDPDFIKDLTRYALKAEKAAIEAEAANQSKVAKMNEEKEALESSWREKLPTAQERYPDFQEKGQSLVDTFSGINAAYGEYLSATLMGLDNGTDVLYYLANNVEEANKIVAAGPSKATVMLAKLDAKFDTPEIEDADPTPPVKVSKAATPPPQNKGSSAARATIPDDTEDLDAFSSKLFDKRYGKRH